MRSHTYEFCSTMLDVGCRLGWDAGSLDREEVRQLLEMCSATSTISDTELDTAMKQLDANGSGEVDLEEFLQYFRHDQDKVCYLLYTVLSVPAINNTARRINPLLWADALHLSLFESGNVLAQGALALRLVELLDGTPQEEPEPIVPAEVSRKPHLAEHGFDRKPPHLAETGSTRSNPSNRSRTPPALPTQQVKAPHYNVQCSRPSIAL